MSALVEKILAHNRAFVAKEEYSQYDTSRYPGKKLAVISCMDTRLVELLPAAMGLKNGDVKLIKNAGGIVTDPFGSVMRSLLVGVHLLHVQEIAVVGHYDCGMKGLDPKQMIEKMLERGIKREEIDRLKYCGFDPESWLKGFDDDEEAVRATVAVIRNHPLMPKDVPVHAFIIDPKTGRLDTVFI
jgi:carbonic anhydrase